MCSTLFNNSCTNEYLLGKLENLSMFAVSREFQAYNFTIAFAIYANKWNNCDINEEN